MADMRATTEIIGEIVVDKLDLQGNGGITMTLSAQPTVTLRQIALVR